MFSEIFNNFDMRNVKKFNDSLHINFTSEIEFKLGFNFLSSISRKIRNLVCDKIINKMEELDPEDVFQTLTTQGEKYVIFKTFEELGDLFKINFTVNMTFVKQ